VLPLLLLLQFFTPAPLVMRGLETLMQGTWVSCPEDDGYGERATDFTPKGFPWFEIHLGPRDEFAIFAGNTPQHIPHDSPLNLLRPAYHYSDTPTAAGGRNWSSAELGVRLNVVAIPPTQEDCYAFVVLLEKDRTLLKADR
jgi:hypothetical protein